MAIFQMVSYKALEHILGKIEVTEVNGRTPKCMGKECSPGMMVLFIKAVMQRDLSMEKELLLDQTILLLPDSGSKEYSRGQA